MDKKIQIVSIVLAVAFSAYVLSSPTDPISLPEPNTNSENDFVSILAKNLDNPRGIAISDNRIFVTEKDGLIRVIENDVLLESPLATFRPADVFDGGLLGITLHPNFSNNHNIYVFLTYEENGNLWNKILQITESNNKLKNVKTIFDKIPGSSFTNGGFIKFGPDGMLPQIQETAIKITEKFGIPAYILADTTWGTCDLNSNGSKILGAEIQFNIGHTINTELFEKNLILINAFDDVDFDTVAKKCPEILKGKTISLVTDSQHLHQVDKVKKILTQNGITVKIGKGKGQLNDGQVFGCEFYPATDLKKEVDAYVFLGQSNFHAAGIALSTNLPTFILDPYFNEVREITEFAQKLKKKATLAIYKAAEAKSFGVIVGLKEGQLSKVFALKIKKELEDEGKKVQLFALTDITNERLKNFKGIDAFIQVACPRISIDNQFDKPLLSTPQANALLKILRNESIEEYLEIPHWL